MIIYKSTNCSWSIFIVILNGNQLKSCPGLQSKLQLSYLRIVSIIPSCGWSAKAAGHQLLTVGRREQESRDSLSSHISCRTLLLDLLVRSMGPRISHRYVCETQIIWLCRVNLGIAHLVGNSEVVNFLVGNREVGNSKVGNSEVGNPEVGNPEVGNSEVGNSEVGNHECT